MSAIQSITDESLIEAIDGAEKRVVLVAPGVWPPIANAVARAWDRLGSASVTAILDVDPEICRLGFGSINGLKILQKAAAEAEEALGHEAGLRICIVIADELTFVFSPTARLVESQPGEALGPELSQPRANGIVLSAPPEMIEDEVGVGTDGDLTRELGLDTVRPEKVEEVAKDLKRNPAKSFDLARAVNVYNAAIRFVELKVHGYRLSQHKASLPKHLVKVARTNKDLAGMIDSAMHFLNENDSLLTGEGVTETTINEKRQKIEEDFLRPITGIGKIIQRDKVSAFEKAIEELKALVKDFAKEVKGALANRYRQTAEKLAKAILPEVLNDLPPMWQQQLGNKPDPEHVRFRIIDDLLQSFGDPEKRIGRMKTTVIYKDVTYDMLKDSDFIAEVAKHFPDLDYVEEYAAAKERENSNPSSQLQFTNL